MSGNCDLSGWEVNQYIIQICASSYTAVTTTSNIACVALEKDEHTSEVLMRYTCNSVLWAPSFSPTSDGSTHKQIIFPTYLMKENH
jgi:hypothetical protein